jgi:hypothetical protein
MTETRAPDRLEVESRRRVVSLLVYPKAILSAQRMLTLMGDGNVVEHDGAGSLRYCKVLVNRCNVCQSSVGVFESDLSLFCACLPASANAELGRRSHVNQVRRLITGFPRHLCQTSRVNPILSE